MSKKAAFLWQKFPKFVLGFLLIPALATASAFTKDQLISLVNLSRRAFLLTFAGVGLRTLAIISANGLPLRKPTEDFRTIDGQHRT